MKSGVLAGVFGVLFQLGYLVGYLALGTVQLFAIFQGMIELWDPSPVLAGFIGLLLAYIPIVGTVLGFFGAVEGWGLSYPLAALIFFFPLVLMIGIFSGVCLAGGIGQLSARGKEIFPKGRLRAVASTVGKGFLGIVGLLAVGLGVLATVESGVLGKDTRAFLFVVATVSILLGVFEYFHSSSRKVYVPALILGLGIFASMPVAFTRIGIEKNNSPDRPRAGYEAGVKEDQRMGDGNPVARKGTPETTASASLSRDPRKQYDYLRLADKLRDESNFTEARKYYFHVLKHADEPFISDQGAALQRIAHSYFMEGHHEVAKKYYLKALNHPGLNSLDRYMVILGMSALESAYHADHQYSKALEICEYLITNDPGGKDIYGKTWVERKNHIQRSIQLYNHPDVVADRERKRIEESNRKLWAAA